MTTTAPKPSPPRGEWMAAKKAEAVYEDEPYRRPRRPEHPDFYLLSKIVNRLDAGFDPETMTDQEMADRFVALVSKTIDYQCLEYMSANRIMLLLMHHPPVFLCEDDMQRLASAYLEGFMVGAAVTRTRAEQEQ